MVVQELFPLGVFRAFFDMESMGDDLEGVFALELIEAFDVVEESLFVTYIIIAFEMVVNFQQVRIFNSNDRFFFVQFTATFVSVLHNDAL